MSVEVPATLQDFPRNKAGYIVPWFVQWFDGEPDFRVADSRKLRDALRFRLCWVCGGRIGALQTFTIGPMCMINRVSAEPPAHYECARYSALACPFLSTPRMVRRAGSLPDDIVVAGEMICRNPGVTVLWSSKTYKSFDDGNGGKLFEIGDPERLEFLREKQQATRAEIEESVISGLPLLREACDKERFTFERKAAHRELDKQIELADALLDRFAPA